MTRRECCCKAPCDCGQPVHVHRCLPMGLDMGEHCRGDEKWCCRQQQQKDESNLS